MTIPSLESQLVAYLAGFFDGEGCINVWTKNGKYGGTGVLYVTVGSTDFSMCRLFHSTFRGYLTSPRLSSPRSRRLSICWKATNGTAVEFLKAIYPYLRVKKRQAALAFKFRKIMDQNLRAKDVHRRVLLLDLAEQIRALNQGQIPDVETVKPTPETVNSQSTDPTSHVGSAL